MDRKDMLSAIAEIPYTICLPTAYGQILVNRYDLNQTNALVKNPFGLDYAEIDLLVKVAKLLPEGSICLDVGANFGVYTLALAKALAPRKGTVHSFEAQRVLAYMVCGSVALNSMENAHIHHNAVGAESGEIDIPAFDYRRVSNFGSVEFGGKQQEFIGQPQGENSGDRVKLVRIDDFHFEKVGIMKIDIEGMEEMALAGAVETIERNRPLVLIEWLKSDKQKLATFFEQRQYEVFVMGGNFLCLPQGCSIKISHQLPRWGAE